MPIQKSPLALPPLTRQWMLAAVVICGLQFSAYTAVCQETNQEETGRAEIKRAETGFALVELFTSQGCSSCPPADRVLKQVLAKSRTEQLPVYCLSFHVDYWDYLGWTDPHSQAAFTKRQRKYASANDERRIYTPQMVVNGKYGFVGSEAEMADRAIRMALATEAMIGVETTVRPATDADQPNVHVDWKTDRAERDGLLQIALVQKAGSNDVPRGENAGRNLDHVNIVRTLETVPMKRETGGSVVMKLPEGLTFAQTEVVVWVQHRESYRVLGGTAAVVTPPSDDIPSDTSGADTR